MKKLLIVLAVTSVWCGWFGDLLGQETQPERPPSEVVQPIVPLSEDMLPLTPGGSDEAPDPRLEEFAAHKFDSGNVGFVLVAAAANLLLLTPGLLLFYCGLNGSRNATSVFMQYLPLAAVLSVAWVLWLFSLGFARNFGSKDVSPGEILAHETEKYRGNPYIGGFEHALLRGLDSQIGTSGPRYPIRRPSDTIPHLLFLTYQMMFFIGVPAPLVVALLNRARLSQAVVLIVIWGSIVYAPVAYWMWGGGWLHSVLDGAGGNAAHVAVGISAIVLTIFLQNPGGARSTASNNTLFVIGTGLYWCGAMISNAGRSMVADGVAVNSALTTHLAACAGVLGWSGADWMVRGKADVRGYCLGALSGLIAIAAGARYVAPQSSLIIGLLAGVAGCAIYSLIQRKSSDPQIMTIAGLHATAGILGVVLAGVFATSASAGFDNKGNPVAGLIGGNPMQLVEQAKAVGCTILLSAVGTLLAGIVIRLTMGFSIPQPESGSEASE